MTTRPYNTASSKPTRISYLLLISTRVIVSSKTNNVENSTSYAKSLDMITTTHFFFF